MPLVPYAISQGHEPEVHNQQSIEGGSPRTAQTSTAHSAKPIRSQRESTLCPSMCERRSAADDHHLPGPNRAGQLPRPVIQVTRLVDANYPRLVSTADLVCHASRSHALLLGRFLDGTGGASHERRQTLAEQESAAMGAGLGRRNHDPQGLGDLGHR